MLGQGILRADVEFSVRRVREVAAVTLIIAVRHYVQAANCGTPLGDRANCAA
jgi:hypothetical protein